MKLKEGFVTHEMGGEQIMVATGSASFSGLVRSNPTAAFIVDCLKEETTREQIIEKMLAKYDATPEVIGADVDKIVAKLRSIKALDE
ncbi:MAG: PqqD family protein [Oscillospiraceae bacterium]|nr:PqqD family protein [Oscillospiraceae bacterium]